MLIFDRITGLIAPHQCVACSAEGSLLCSDCIEEYYQTPIPRCIGCMKQQDTFLVCTQCKSWLPLQSVFFCGAYDGMFELLIKELKFGHKRQATQPIAQMIAQLPFNLADIPVVCPVPTAPSRIRERGFDHTKMIARLLASNLHLNQAQVLKRHSNTRQLGANRTTRFKQMKKEFYTNKATIPKNVLLVDDVFTTGGTLAAAAETLKNAGVKQISAVIFARKN